jgi:hypothetical protein
VTSGVRACEDIVHYYLLEPIKQVLGETYEKGCRCGERLIAKAAKGERLAHAKVERGKGDTRRGKWIGGEKFASVKSEIVLVKLWEHHRC